MKIKLINQKEFDAMTDAEKRVAIARDVLARIDAGLLVPSGCAYTHDSIKGSGKDYFNSNQCSVCAKGALLCSWIGNFNKYNIEDIRGRGTVKELRDLFGDETLKLIEIYFEGWSLPDTGKKVDRMTLTQIMQNIIDNGGEFIPS
jgi:hypothetical protein